MGVPWGTLKSSKSLSHLLSEIPMVFGGFFILRNAHMVETTGLHPTARDRNEACQRNQSQSENLQKRPEIVPGLVSWQTPHLTCGYVHFIFSWYVHFICSFYIFMIFSMICSWSVQWLPKEIGDSGISWTRKPWPGDSPGCWNLRRQLQRPLGTIWQLIRPPRYFCWYFWNPQPSNDWWLYDVKIDVICSNGLGLLVFYMLILMIFR